MSVRRFFRVGLLRVFDKRKLEAHRITDYVHMAIMACLARQLHHTLNNMNFDLAFAFPDICVSYYKSVRHSKDEKII